MVDATDEARIGMAKKHLHEIIQEQALHATPASDTPLCCEICLPCAAIAFGSRMSLAIGNNARSRQVLVLANKSDLPGALSGESVRKELQIEATAQTCHARKS